MGLSQETLSLKAGINRTYIGSLESFTSTGVVYRFGAGELVTG